MNLDLLSRLLERDPKTSVLRHLDAFRDLANSLDVGALVCQEMGRWLTHPRRPPPIVSENTVRIQNLGRFALDVTILKVAGAPRFVSSHQDILQRFYVGGCYNIFEIVKEDGMPTGLRQGARGLLSDGDVLGVDGSEQVFVAHSAKPIRFLSLSEFESRGIRYKFDSQSLRLVGTFAASPVSTTIQLAARFLGYYGDAKCVPALRHLLDDPIGAIQWEAACALTRVDHDAGLAAMKRLALSRDRDVAQAARETLDRAAG